MNKKPSEFQTEAEQKKGIVKTKNNKTKNWTGSLLNYCHSSTMLLRYCTLKNWLSNQGNA